MSVRSVKIKNRTMTRRIFSIFTLKTLSLMVISSGLYKLQILDRQKYKTLSDTNRIRLVLKEPIRSSMYDSNNNALATHQKTYSIICTSELVKDKDTFLKNIESIIELTPEKRTKLKNYLRSRVKNFTVATYVDWSTIEKIEFKIIDLQGIRIDVSHTRIYPYGEICAHIIGYTGYGGPDNKKIGKCGMEKALEEKLCGRPGIIQQEVNSKEQLVRIIKETPPIPGHDINLSIDIKLQKFVHSLLSTNNTSVVVLELETGNIKSINSFPSYDNNLFISGLSNAKWEKLVKDKNLPMLNRSIQSQVHPSSTFKLISALTALETKITNKSTEVQCLGHITIGNHKFHCMNRAGHGWVDLEQALAQSCNIYFFHLAMQIHIDDLMHNAYKFGLGQKFETGLKEESLGIIPNKKWRNDNIKKTWKLGDTINSVIGQGYLTSTPLQLAVMSARFATGTAIIPKIIHNNDIENFNKLTVKSEHMDTLRNCMYKVVHSNIGTARKFAPKDYNIAGKTGTAQLTSINNNHQEKSHAIFIGYAPYENPKHAISVVIEHGEFGYNAAKIATLVFDYIIKNKTQE